MDIYKTLFLNGQSVDKPSDSYPSEAPLSPMAIPEAPMQVMSLDIAFIPKDHDVFHYFLFIGDIFLGYLAVVPLQDRMAPVVADALLSYWTYIHGVLLHI